MTGPADTVFLRDVDNPLLKRPLELADVKHMPLGHWGTTRGQNFIYVHLNQVVKQYIAKYGRDLPEVRDWRWASSL